MATNLWAPFELQYGYLWADLETDFEPETLWVQSTDYQYVVGLYFALDANWEVDRWFQEHPGCPRTEMFEMGLADGRADGNPF